MTPQDTVAHCLNYQMWMGGLTDHMTLQQTGALVIPFGVGSTELLIRTIQEVGVTALSCTPSYPAVLERVIAEKFPGLAPRDLGLRLGLFGGEAGLDDPALRARLKETWGMEPRNANYGVSDVFSNFAAQCEHDTCLHFVAADVLYPEIINPDSGAPLAMADGTTGELVLTHLARDCQPLVRFRTGDIITITATGPLPVRLHRVPVPRGWPVRRHDRGARAEHVPDHGCSGCHQLRRADRRLSHCAGPASAVR